MPRNLIALVGDFNPNVMAHQAIQACFALLQQSGSQPLESQWVATESVTPGNERTFESAKGIWCVPASPYRNTEGALWAIQYARTKSIPFLGTCGGYQHALLEYARNVLGLNAAGHSELDPGTAMPLLDRMQCSIIEQSQRIVVSNENFRSIYGAKSGLEGFHCSYGLNSKYEQIFAGTSLEIGARSEDGQVRAFRLRNHPFFVGTQFQPERRALTGVIHPLVMAFFSVITNR